MRLYEAEGLIVPGRCSNGYRDYCRSTVDRVLVIRSLLESGLPLRLIKEILPHLVRAGGGAADLCPGLLAEVRAFRDRLAGRIAVLNAQHDAVDAFLQEAEPADRTGP